MNKNKYSVGIRDMYCISIGLWIKIYHLLGYLFTDNEFEEYDEQHLNIYDIAKNNDAFLFIMSMDGKQSFVQCIDLIKNIESDKQNYNYKYDLNKNKHQLKEADIAEFVVDIGSPFILIAPDNFKEPFNRAIEAIPGYSTASSFIKVNNLPDNDTKKFKALLGKLFKALTEIK